MCLAACNRRPGSDHCPECEAEYLLDHDADMAVNSLAARDPEADPTHKAATDREWWDFITGSL